MTGVGTVTITPILPLPALGVPQASTMTLTVTDDLHTRQSSFLYVVSDETSLALTFSRPSGIYSLDPNLNQHRDDDFLTGEMHGVKWAHVERVIDQFDWQDFNDEILSLPIDQDLSLNLQQEPCYIADSSNLDFDPWCDLDTTREPDPDDCTTTACTGGTPPQTGYLRAVPWDTYLWDRREKFLDELYKDLSDVGKLAKVSIINTNLPGGFNGIRNVSEPFDPSTMPGYTREALLSAIQHELRTVQDKFPGGRSRSVFSPRPTAWMPPTTLPPCGNGCIRMRAVGLPRTGHIWFRYLTNSTGSSVLG